MMNGQERRHRGGWWRGVAGAALAAILLCAWPDAAVAQTTALGEQGERLVNSDKPALFVTFGISSAGAMRPNGDTWLPVALVVQGGSKPFEGVVRAEFQQDATQSASIVTAVAATPGKMSTYRVALPLPAVAGRVEFALISRTGAVQQRLVYSSSPDRDELPLPPLFGPVELAVLAVGSAGSPATSISVMSAPSSARNARAARTGSIAPEDLPATWAALDSTPLLVVDADGAQKVDPRSMAAVHEWVSAGGRLVVVATKAGSEWREWLPPAPFGAVVAVEDPSTGEVPEELAAAIRAKPRAPVTPLDSFAETSPNGGYSDPGDQMLPMEVRRSPVPSGENEDARPRRQIRGREEAAIQQAGDIRAAGNLPRRVVRLTPQGEAAGWRVRWRTDGEEGPKASSMGAAGLIADGPIGFGWVAVVGVDVRKAAAVTSNAPTMAAWEGVLRPVLASIAAQNGAQGGNAYYGLSSGDVSTNIVLDSLSRVPTVGHGAFLVIVGAMVGLALVLGPVDAVVLGRLRKRHRSWLTAAGWIALASLVAYKAPLLGRRSVTIVNRASIVDAMIPPGASVGAAPADGGPSPIRLGDGGAAPLAWSTSLTGIFAGASGVYSLEGPRLACSWWRGVSAISYYGREQTMTSGVVPAALVLPDLASVGASRDPWGGWNPAVSAELGSGGGGCVAEQVPLSLWTFRTLQDRARTTPPCDVRIEAGESGRSVVISGLAPGATVRAAACRVNRRWYPITLSSEGASGDRTTWHGPLGKRTAVPPEPWRPLQANQVQGYYTPYGGEAADREDGLEKSATWAFGVPGEEERTARIDMLLGDKRWACMCLVIDGAPCDVRIRGAQAIHTRTIYARILVPWPPEEPASGAAP